MEARVPEYGEVSRGVTEDWKERKRKKARDRLMRRKETKRNNRLKDTAYCYWALSSKRDHWEASPCRKETKA
jgi:hypothetical protein